MSCCGLFACFNMCVTNLPPCSLFPNVCVHRPDVTAADSRPVHLPQAQCQGIIGHLVVKFQFWQKALKPSRVQMKREQPGQSDDFSFPTNYIICPFACSQINELIVQRGCHCLDTVSIVFHFRYTHMWHKSLLLMQLWCFCLWSVRVLKLTA